MLQYPLSFEGGDLMRFFSQLFTFGIIFWVFSILYPNYIIISNLETLIIAAVIYSVLCYVFIFITLNSILSSLISGQFIAAIIISLFFSIIVSYCTLYATEALIAGFQITNSTLRLIIATALAFLANPNPNN